LGALVAHPMKYKDQKEKGSRIVLCRLWRKKMMKKNTLLSLYSKKFDYSLGGYSHRERWSRTWWKWKTSTSTGGGKSLITYWSKLSTSLSKALTWNINTHSFNLIGRDLRIGQRKQLEDFGYWNSQTRLTMEVWFSSRVVAIKSLNAMVVKIVKVNLRIRPAWPSIRT
jgi:hypothetical protein